MIGKRSRSEWEAAIDAESDDVYKQHKKIKLEHLAHQGEYLWDVEAYSREIQKVKHARLRVKRKKKRAAKQDLFVRFTDMTLAEKVEHDRRTCELCLGVSAEDADDDNDLDVMAYESRHKHTDESAATYFYKVKLHWASIVADTHDLLYAGQGRLTKDWKKVLKKLRERFWSLYCRSALETNFAYYVN